MDTPSASSETTPLNIDSAAQAFASLLEPKKQEISEATESEATPTEAADEEVNVEAQDDQPEEVSEDGTVTIEVDGKQVTMTKAELAEAYKNGLRQSDYTKKTMEVAEQRKAAEAEIARAREERTRYEYGLNQANAVLAAQLQERTAEQWDALAKTDPAAWVAERSLYEQRYAAYQQNQQQLQQLQAMSKAEAQAQRQSYLAQQQEELLAKLPDWKDAAKASAEKQALAKYLQEQGFEDSLISQIADHRHVLVARKAMLYDLMMSKASAAAKKVQAAPQKVVKPGVGDSPRLDGRSAAMQRLSKSGRVEDAAAVFASFI